MDSKIYSSILKTICYADVFDYPLKEKEVRHWIKDSRILGYSDIKKANGVIIHRDDFMFMKGREELIKTRLQRGAISKRKLFIAKRVASLLGHIPTIKLIGVSGSVAMSNASKEDDIDLFIITAAHTVWLTRFLTTFLVELFSKRRHPNDTVVADKICLNMFVDENYLGILEEKQNFYTAHEVCQLKLLYEKDNTYQKFLTANRWVRKYLPNGIMIKDKGLRIKEKSRKISFIIHHLSFIIEFLAKHLQLWYMRKRLTTEVISDHYLAFHPKDYTKDILAAFEQRVKLYGAQV